MLSAARLPPFFQLKDVTILSAQATHSGEQCCPQEDKVVANTVTHREILKKKAR